MSRTGTGARTKINQLADARPDIEMKPINNRWKAEIVVKNNGEAGIIKAKLVFTGSPAPSNLSAPREFDCQWDTGNDDEVIQYGGERHLQIASFSQVSTPLAHVPANCYLTFIPYSRPDTEGVAIDKSFATAHWIANTEPPLAVPEINFRVIVTSAPRGINTPLTKFYRITPTGIFDEIIQT